MGYELLRLTRPKARKDHVCIWCGELIQRGDTYARESSVYDGDFQDFKWHPECNEAADRFFSSWGEDLFEAYSFGRGSVNEPGEPIE